jgi:hypothetical protein
MHGSKRKPVRTRCPHTTFLAVLILLAICSVPAFANHSSSVVVNNRTTAPLSHNGLPCSTSSNGVAAAAKADSTVRQLDGVERQSLNLPKTPSAPKNLPLYHPTKTKPEKQIPIEFVYHAPNTRH